MHTVLIHPAAYDTVRESVDRAFALFPMDLEGKKVLLKPNVLRAATPEEAVTTHPAVLRAVVEKVSAMNPAELSVGDNPGPLPMGPTRRALKRRGSWRLQTDITGISETIPDVWISTPGFCRASACPPPCWTPT